MSVLGRRLITAVQLQHREDQLRRAAWGPFAARQQAVLATLRARTASAWDDDLDGLGDEAGDAARQALSGSLRTVLKDVNDLFDGVTLPTIDVTDRLDRVQRLVAELGQSTVTALNDTLTEGTARGESMDKLAARVRSTFGASEARARLIARTEVVGASNDLSHRQAVNAANMGLSLRKRWLATSDDRTRDSHVEVDGTAVDLDATFTVGFDELLYPGDPGGSPEECCNCRCVCLYEPVTLGDD